MYSSTKKAYLNVKSTKCENNVFHFVIFRLTMHNCWSFEPQWLIKCQYCYEMVSSCPLTKKIILENMHDRSLRFRASIGIICIIPYHPSWKHYRGKDILISVSRLIVGYLKCTCSRYLKRKPLSFVIYINKVIFLTVAYDHLYARENDRI